MPTIKIGKIVWQADAALALVSLKCECGWRWSGLGMKRAGTVAAEHVQEGCP